MVIYDQWPYMTMLDIPDVVFIALRAEIQIDMLLLGEGDQSVYDIGKLFSSRLLIVSFYGNTSAAVSNKLFNLVPVFSDSFFRPLTLDDLCYAFSHSAN